MIKKTIIIISSLLFLAPVLFSVPHAGAFDLFGSPCDTNAKNGSGSSAVCQDKNSQQSPTATNPITDTIKKVADVLALIAGIAAVILIVISGFMFVTAGGSIGGQRGGDNPAKAAKARSTLSSALVGLVIVALAWTIVTFITDKFIH